MNSPLRRTGAPAMPMSNAEPGARLRINPANPVFTDRVMADVHRIRRTAAGRALFRRLRDLGRTITIEKPEPPTEPPNAWTVPRADGAIPGEFVVAYDPADWPDQRRPGCPPSDVILFGRLLDIPALVAGTTAVAAPETEPPSLLADYVRERAALHGPAPSPQP